MNDNIPEYKIGEVVEVVMGRDKGSYALVIGFEDERFVYLVDGDKRKFDNPKRKNIRHIRSARYISKEAAENLEGNNRISNAKLRYIIKDFISNHLNNGEEKGE